MDVATISSLVQNLGFPIVIVGVLMWYINKIQDNHKEEMNGLRDAIIDMKNVIQRVLDKLG